MVTVPSMADQLFWATRVHEIGAGPAPIPVADLTPERLTTATQAALEQPRYRHRATELAHLINSEDGAATVLAHIEQLTS